MRISTVEAIPLTAPLPRVLRTAQDEKATVSLVLVRIETDEGLHGWGEVLGRWTPRSYASIVEDLFAPRLLGRDPFEAEAIWLDLASALTGRGGGMLVEAIAGVDIALWDLMARSLGVPIHRLLGGVGRKRLPAYASSIMVEDPDETRAAAERIAATSFRALKVKLEGNLGADLDRVALVRSIVGRDRALYVDANWGYSLADAIELGRRLTAFDVGWLEEPLQPNDRDGYQILARSSPTPIAAGESEYTSVGIRDLVASRALAVVQPDIARSGGITETRKIGVLSQVFEARFAPHVGFSGVVCVAATMQLAAASANFHSLETMVFANPLREELTSSPIDAAALLDADGTLPVPEGPGLGIDLDMAAVDRYRI